MSIDININEMFSERNQTLFFNKVAMDIDNNGDTFKLATKNTIMIEIAKLLSSLKKIYGKYLIEIKEDKIKELLSNTKKSMLEEVNIIIDEKSLSNKKYMKQNKDEKIDTRYLKQFHKHIDESERTFEENLTLVVKENTEVNLYNSLVNMYPCIDENMHDELLQLINLKFSNTLVNRINNESTHRNMTLKNMSEETYKKYLDLNKSSDNLSKNNKIKVKKD